MARTAAGRMVVALVLSTFACGGSERVTDAGPPTTDDAAAPDAGADAEVDATEPAAPEDPCLGATGYAEGSAWPMRGGCPRRPSSRARLRGPSNGTLAFTYATTGRATSPVLTEGGLVVFGTDDGRVVAVSAAGQKQWDVDFGRPVSVSPFVRSAEEIVVAGNDGRIARLAVADGSIRGEEPGAREPSELLPLGDGVAYTAADKKLHRTSQDLREVSALDVSSREAPTLAKDGAILVAGDDGALRRVEGTQTTVIYRAPAALTFAPAIGFYGDVFVVGKDDVLRSLAPSGALRFERPLGSPALAAPATSPDGAVYVATTAGKVLGFDRTGKETVSFAPLGVPEAPIVGAQGNAFFGAEDTKIYAVLPTGRLAFAGSLRVRARGQGALSEGGMLFLPVEGGIAGVGP